MGGWKVLGVNLLPEIAAIGTVPKNGTSYVNSQTLAGGSATFTDATGGVTAMVYDGKGSLTSLTDPLNNITSFA